MLLIETSSGDDFEDTRSFYRKHGYDEEGTVRDFYAGGADKVVTVEVPPTFDALS